MYGFLGYWRQALQGAVLFAAIPCKPWLDNVPVFARGAFFEACQPNNHQLSWFPKLNPISGAGINPHLRHFLANGLDISRIPAAHRSMRRRIRSRERMSCSPSFHWAKASILRISLMAKVGSMGHMRRKTADVDEARQSSFAELVQGAVPCTSRTKFIGLLEWYQERIA